MPDHDIRGDELSKGHTHIHYIPTCIYILLPRRHANTLTLSSHPIRPTTRTVLLPRRSAYPRPKKHHPEEVLVDSNNNNNNGPAVKQLAGAAFLPTRNCETLRHGWRSLQLLDEPSASAWLDLTGILTLLFCRFRCLSLPGLVPRPWVLSLASSGESPLDCLHLQTPPHQPAHTPAHSHNHCHKHGRNRRHKHGRTRGSHPY